MSNDRIMSIQSLKVSNKILMRPRWYILYILLYEFLFLENIMILTMKFWVLCFCIHELGFVWGGFMSKGWSWWWRALTRRGLKKILTYLIGSWVLRIWIRSIKFHKSEGTKDLTSFQMKALTSLLRSFGMERFSPRVSQIAQVMVARLLNECTFFIRTKMNVLLRIPKSYFAIVFVLFFCFCQMKF